MDVLISNNSDSPDSLRSLLASHLE